ncbi:MAG: GNAT family N-acyltransferase [Kiritimatiellia bacterium]
MENDKTIFEIPWRTIQRPFLRKVLRFSHRLIETLLGLRYLCNAYQQIKAAPRKCHFPQQILLWLRTKVSYSIEDFARIPSTGTLMVIANHPYGAIEGLALLELIRRKRPDVKVLANTLLSRIPELREDLIFVDPFGSVQATKSNIHAMRHSLSWLQNGHALIVFPAGEVASFAPKAFRVRDPEWHTSIMTLIRRCRCETSILPVFIPGMASLPFHLLGKIHPRLRTIMLPREMIRLRKRTLTLRVGVALSSSVLFKRFTTDVDALRYLRFRTFLLAGRAKSKFEERMRRLTLDLDSQKSAPIIAPISPALIDAELMALSPEAWLLTNEDMAVVAARGDNIPQTLREIGRLREITFRAVGEGTGTALDADEFDATYYHVILWHRLRHEIVGCYRLGLSDELIENHGLNALYTRSLFKFDERFLGHLSGPAVELGRSFVCPEYQKAFAPLLLLWRGVLTFIAERPRYTVLFGPVSITHNFRPAARDMLIEYLHARCYDWSLAKWVSARLPPKRPHFVEWRSPDYADFLRTETDVNTALSEIEDGRREMPVLIRQYLKLGGRICAFNVDPEFGIVVDGLIVVDLLKVPARDMARYMGAERYQLYRTAPREENA